MKLKRISTAELERNAALGAQLIRREELLKDLGPNYKSADSGSRIGDVKMIRQHLAWVLRYFDEADVKKELKKIHGDLARYIVESEMPKAERSIGTATAKIHSARLQRGDRVVVKVTSPFLLHRARYS